MTDVRCLHCLLAASIMFNVKWLLISPCHPPRPSLDPVRPMFLTMPNPDKIKHGSCVTCCRKEELLESPSLNLSSVAYYCSLRQTLILNLYNESSNNGFSGLLWRWHAKCSAQHGSLGHCSWHLSHFLAVLHLPSFLCVWGGPLGEYGNGGGTLAPGEAEEKRSVCLHYWIQAGQSGAHTWLIGFIDTKIRNCVLLECLK